MSGHSRTSEAVQAWAERSAVAANRGEVCEENLRSLLGSPYEPSQAWPHAIEAYSVMLASLTRFEGVLKLIVPLTPRQCVDTEMSTPDIAAEIDLTSAPSLVIHTLLPRRDWAPFEEYRRPFDASAFIDDDARPKAQAMYIWFRDIHEIADRSDYRRQILFERIQSAQGAAESHDVRETQ